MNTVNAQQLKFRLAVVVIAIVGGLMEFTWVHTLGLNCDFLPGEGLKIIIDCDRWTDLFISYSGGQRELVSGIVFVAAFLTILSGLIAPWKPLMSGVVLVIIVILNLIVIIPWWLGAMIPKVAMISSFMFIVSPALLGVALFKFGR